MLNVCGVDTSLSRKLLVMNEPRRVRLLVNSSTPSAWSAHHWGQPQLYSAHQQIAMAECTWTGQEVLLDGNKRERMRIWSEYPEAEMIFSSVVLLVLIITQECPPLSLGSK